MRTNNLLLIAILVILFCTLFLTAHMSAEQKIFESSGRFPSLEFSKSVPAQLNYQGYLVDSSDSSAVTSTLEMTFKLFDSEADGVKLWLETHPAVDVNNGTFQVLLGSVTPFPAGLFDGSERWLQTEIGAEVLSPRKPLVSVAYSQTDGDWTMAGGNLYRMDGNVGIGRDNPIRKLDIVGDQRILGKLYLARPDSSESLMNIYNYGGSDWELVAASGADRFDIREFGGDPSLSIAAGGKVGIGTISPNYPLDVSGSARATTFYGDGSNLTGISGTTDNDWAIDGDNVYHQTGNVGIGTTSPSARLDVQGTLNVGEDDTGYDVNFYGAGGGGRFSWNESKMALRTGRDTDGTYWMPDSIGSYSLATGYDTKASGNSSIALGTQVIASGNMSFATGWQATASGPVSIATGVHVTASGDYSTAMGGYTTASGDYSTAIGHNVTAGPADNTIVLGHGTPLINNIENSLMVGFETDEPTLFVGGPDHRVGIGTTSPSSELDVNGAVNTASPYQIAGNAVLSTEGTGNILVGIGAGANNTGADGTFLGAYAGHNNQGEDNTFLGSWAGYANTTGANNTFVGLGAGRYNMTGSNSTFLGYMAGFNETGSNKLYIDNSSTDRPLIWGDFENNRLVVNGNASDNLFNRTFFSNGSAGGTTAWQNDSDERLKKNIMPIPDALQKVQRLRGVNFEWRDTERHESGRQMGFVAQEAVEIIPEVVSGEEGHYAMQYGPITALLVEAVKELSEENRELREEIEAIKAGIR